MGKDSLNQAGIYADALKEAFIYDMAVAGQYSANLFNYPLAAMIACACYESGFGTSDIYKRTGNPFNIQKPSAEFCQKHHMPKYDWPKCETLDQVTQSTGSIKGPAPFCIATDLQDAARQFCEWISGFPRKSSRDAVEFWRHNAVEFASSLWRVGFAANNPSETKKYGGLVVSLKLQERYSVVPAQ